MSWRTWAAAAICVCACRAGQAAPDPVLLLSRVRSKVISDAKKIPRFMCRQTTERRTFTISGKSDCSAAIAARNRTQAAGRLHLAEFDRVKLDVILAQNAEMFAWPGEVKFDAKNPGDLLRGGLSGTGDFAGFVIHIFTIDEVTFNYQGSCASDSCARFGYRMPLEAKAYVLRTRLNEAAVGYHGTFDVDPQTAELLRLSVMVDEPEKAYPNLCELQTEMTYTRSDTQSGRFMIPKSTVKNLLIADGHYLENRGAYESCHEYTAQSELTFNAKAPVPKPPDPLSGPPRLPPSGTRLDLRLTSRIDTDTASEGDVLEGTLTKNLLDSSGAQIAAAGTAFRGHLARLEHIYGAKPGIAIGIQFDTIVAGGKEFPVPLAAAGNMDARGMAVFTFHVSRVKLGRLVTHWVVREPIQQPSYKK